MQLRNALPETLRDNRAVEVLERSLARDRIAHGILLHGENMKSLESIVRAISAELLQTDRDPYKHTDCFVLRPSGKARRIVIETMHKLVADIRKTSYQGGRKVGILLEADRMNVSSANAFLKTLEEPPGDTTIFLLTTRPYDLLDTIRSRCLKFRVPATVEQIAHQDWPAWTNDYRDWLGRLLTEPVGRNKVDFILVAYGLNARFQAILQELTETAWNAHKKNLPEEITPKEKEAMEKGLERDYSWRLFGKIEQTTSNFLREVETLNPGRLPVNALVRATQAIEHSARLLEINFKRETALELFFLKSLRIWTAVR